MTAASKRISYSAAMTRRPTPAILALLLCATATHAQVKIVDPEAQPPVAVAPSSQAPPVASGMSADAEAMAKIRRLLAEDRPSQAKKLADDWIEQRIERRSQVTGVGDFIGGTVFNAIFAFISEAFSTMMRSALGGDDNNKTRNDSSDSDHELFPEDAIDVRHSTEVTDPSPYFAEAYYLRGNAKLAMGNEFASLYDYEEVIKNHPESEQFVPCLERELQVARLYLNGRKKPSNLFGLRLDSGKPLAEEIILRICERLPGSRLAERAILELADYYARARDLELAAETYDVFLRLYPRSDQRSLAMQRRVYANIARFKGPGYDAAALKDAMVQIEEFQEEFPAEAQRTGVSDALMARVDESAAAGLLKNARWYLRKDDSVSARLTLTRLIKRHPRTGAAQQAVTMIQEIDAAAAAAPVEQEP